MARPKSQNETRKVHPTLSEQMLDFLDDLIAIGNYGNSRSEVARYLIQRGIDDLLRNNVLRPSRRLAQKAD